MWLQILRESGLPYQPTGSLHAAYRTDEQAVGLEFAEKAPKLSFDCTWLSAREALARSYALQHEGLQDALWSPMEI